MKQNIGPGVVVAVVAAVVAIVGFIGYKTLFHDPNQTSAQGPAAEKQIEDIKKNSAIYKSMEERQQRALAREAPAAGSLVGHGAYGAGMRSGSR